METLIGGLVGLLMLVQTGPLDRPALLERLSRAIPERGFVGFVGIGSTRRESLVEQNPGQDVEVDAAVKRHEACLEPFVGETAMRQLILRRLEETLTDSQLAEVVTMLEGPDFAKLLQLMSRPLGAETDKDTLDAAARIAVQRGFSIFGAVVNDAIGDHLRAPLVQAGIASCDEALARDLATGGPKSGS